MRETRGLLEFGIFASGGWTAYLPRAFGMRRTPVLLRGRTGIAAVEATDEPFMAGGESIAPRGRRRRPERLKAHGPEPRFGGKPACIRSHWKGRTAFLKDGRVEIDSHAAGNPVRPVMAARTDFLLAGHGNGAKARDCAASMSGAFGMNGIGPRLRLKAAAGALAGDSVPGPRPHDGPFGLQRGIGNPRPRLNPGKPPHPAGLGEARPQANGRACPAGARLCPISRNRLASGPALRRLAGSRPFIAGGLQPPLPRQSAAAHSIALLPPFALGRGGLFLALRAAERQEAESAWRNPPERRRKPPRSAEKASRRAFPPARRNAGIRRPTR